MLVGGGVKVSAGIAVHSFAVGDCVGAAVSSAGPVFVSAGRVSFAGVMVLWGVSRDTPALPVQERRPMGSRSKTLNRRNRMDDNLIWFLPVLFVFHLLSVYCNAVTLDGTRIVKVRIPINLLNIH